MPGKKQNNRKSGASRRNKERKRAEAILRQSIYDGMNSVEKLSMIRDRRGESAKETNKLLALLA